MKTNAIKLARALVWLVYAWTAVTIVLLLLAFLLQLLGADPTAGFVEWVYRSTQRAMAPFRGSSTRSPLSDESVFDVSILFAIIVLRVRLDRSQCRPRLAVGHAAHGRGT